jgi:hypothetical protein
MKQPVKIGHLFMLSEHRLFWSTRYVKRKLIERSLSEQATFAYFLAVMAFDWLQFSVIAATPNPRVEAWSVANTWITFAMTVLGLVYLFARNQGGRGGQFMSRFFPLSVTVGWKCGAVLYVLIWLVEACFGGQGPAVVGWLSTTCVAVVNAFMFWRIGRHLHAIAHASEGLNETESLVSTKRRLETGGGLQCALTVRSSEARPPLMGPASAERIGQ